jgi:DNA-binding NtrC family response regulator
MTGEVKTILIVDSDKDMCWLLERVLKAKNCHIMASDSWENILGLVSQKKPDLVLLDMPLNNISPTKMLNFIRDSQPDTPVIVIAPYVNEGLVSQMKGLGNYKFIAKPFVIENLILAVKQALSLPGE